MYMLTPFKDHMYSTNYASDYSVPYTQTVFKKEKFINQCKIDEMILNHTIFEENILHSSRQKTGLQAN